MTVQSIQRRKRTGLWFIAVSSLALVILVVASVILSRHESDDDRFLAMFDPKVRQQMTEREREQLMQQWKNLDPETKKRVSQEAFHQAVDRFREEFGKKSEAQQKAWVDSEVSRMQERFQNLTTEQRAQGQERLQTPESQAFLKNVFSTYHEELSARERSLLEPLAREFIAQLESFR